jgi:hypothetical protein
MWLDEMSFYMAKSIWLACVFLVFAIAMTQAQEDECPQLVIEALKLAEEICEPTGTSELCYGHYVLQADPQIWIEDFRFDEPGDIEAVSRVRSLRLSGMDTAEDIWGVAVMRVRALLRGELNSEDVIFLLFGDVVVDNAVNLLELEVLRDGNIRQRPSTNAPIVGGVSARDRITADGRTEDGGWVHIRLDDNQRSAWISAVLIDPTDAINALPVIDENDVASNDGLLYGAMQAFYFRSGVDDAPCREAPNSGMLIQTPEGEAEVTLLMNEANIQLRATAYVQADPGDRMTLYLIEGEARVEVEGVERTLVAGTSVTVELNENGVAEGPPSEPEPYDMSQLQMLPVSLLARPVQIAEPLSQPVGVPVSGEWNFFWLVSQDVCPDGRAVAFETENPHATVRVDESGESFVMLLTRYIRDESGVYRTIFTDASGNIHTYSVRATALDRMAGEAQIEYLFGCTLTVPFEMRLVSAAR